MKPIKTVLSKALEIAVGMLIFYGFFLLGGLLKGGLHLILPANVLGMLLLLVAISTKVIRLKWIETAGKWLLFILPLLFVPIYVGAGAYKEIWIRWGWIMVPSLIASVLAMWIFTGYIAQGIFRRKS